jgi:hypothetical protein
MPNRKISISMPEELHERMKKFDGSWSEIARRCLEQEVRIREAMADGDRNAALREKARANCADVGSAGLEDALTYPIEEIEYSFLQDFEERGRDCLESSDPVNWMAVFDELNGTFGNGTQKFRLRFRDSSDYKLGFMQGLLNLKRIADGMDERTTKTTSIFGNHVNKLKED